MSLSIPPVSCKRLSTMTAYQQKQHDSVAWTNSPWEGVLFSGSLRLVPVFLRRTCARTSWPVHSVRTFTSTPNASNAIFPTSKVGLVRKHPHSKSLKLKSLLAHQFCKVYNCHCAGARRHKAAETKRDAARGAKYPQQDVSRRTRPQIPPAANDAEQFEYPGVIILTHTQASATEISTTDGNSCSKTQTGKNLPREMHMHNQLAEQVMEEGRLDEGLEAARPSHRSLCAEKGRLDIKHWSVVATG